MGKKVLLALGATFACLLFAELLLRLLGTAPGVTRLEIDLPHGSFQSSRNAVLGYEPRPGSLGVNDYGIHDHDYDLDKPEGTIRILVIGDSIGYGFCNDGEALHLDSLFMKQLEQSLQKTFPAPVEVINLCVSGYDTVQEVEFLAEKGLALDPDMVLVAYCLNDDFDASMEMQYFKQQSQFGIDSEIGQKVFLSSHLARLFWLSNWKPEPQAPGQKQKEKVSRTERGFARLADMAQKEGFQPVIVVFPLFEPIEAYRWYGSHQRVAALARQFGFPALDLIGPFSEATDGDLRKLQGRCNREHPDEKGHAAAAVAIENFLKGTGLLRTP
jgi:lysophospholipase L1-like esterase